MQYIIDHIPLSQTHRPGIKIVPKSICVHNTGNPKSTDTNEHNWLENDQNKVYASAHVFIDENSATECIPLNEMAYHSGNRKGNSETISIEICEVGNYEQTLINVKELIVKMLKERGWNTSNLNRHFDWSGKVCPRKFFDKIRGWEDWDKFVSEIKGML